MKVIQISKYNRKHIDIELAEIEQPKPKAGEVLIAIKAAGVNPVDNKISEGQLDLVLPIRFPYILGHEFSGVVAELGEGVKDFVIGDKVFGLIDVYGLGSFAEYICIKADKLAKMPEGLTYEEAASIPVTALTAYQCLDMLGAKSGQSLFISGASGGLGAMAVPQAKRRGLRVYTSGSAKNRDRLLSLGVDAYFDYKTEDYAAALGTVDHIIDTVGTSEYKKEVGMLAKGGTIVSISALPDDKFAKRFGLPRWKQWLFKLAGYRLNSMAKARGGRYEFHFVESNGRQLREIAELLREGVLTPSVDSVYPFEEAYKALDRVKAGGVVGKVILRID